MRAGWSILSAGSQCREPCIFRLSKRARLLELLPIKIAELLTAGFLTGARYGELIARSVCDFDPVARTLKVDGKTGPRGSFKALRGIVTFAKYRRVFSQFGSTTRALRH